MKKLLEVKKKIGVLSKDSKNPFFKSQYLSLNELLNAVDPLLHEEGLILLQPIVEGVVKSQIIDCENNNTLAESSLDLPDIKDPQKLGSAITYYRRYTLKSLLAISEEDDDGNKASKQKPKPFEGKLKPEAVKQAIERIKNGEDTLIEKMKAKYDLTVEEVQILVPKNNTLSANDKWNT